MKYRIMILVSAREDNLSQFCWQLDNNGNIKEYTSQTELETAIEKLLETTPKDNIVAMQYIDFTLDATV